MKVGCRKKKYAYFIVVWEVRREGEREQDPHFQRNALSGPFPPRSHLFIDSTFEEHIQLKLTNEFFIHKVRV